MIAFEKALELILSDVRKMGTEQVSLDEALYRILAEDIFSDVDMPPFDKAAMDGFACRRADLAGPLTVMEVVAAGETPSRAVGPGQCTKVMTGAMVPEGADTVIIIEQTAVLEDGRIRFTGQHTTPNIARKAEDVVAGDLIWRKGTQVLPQHVAMLASAGRVRPLVARKPVVGVLSTGDELVEPGNVPGQGKIRNSNGAQLVAQVNAAHCTPNYMGIIPDDEEITRQMIRKALAENDVVILSGGVSMGDFDFVPRIMKEEGVHIVFQKVAVKPGRPTVFGLTDKASIFGLPGNPVSSFINFEVMVKPLLLCMMGNDVKAREYPMKLGVPFARKKDDRPEWIPVYDAGAGKVIPVSYHGSAHIHALSLADGLVFIPRGVTRIPENDYVTFHPLG